MTHYQAQTDQQRAREICDRILQAVVGPHLVQDWWESPNKAFGLQSPQTVWDTSAWPQVYGYLRAQLNGGYL